MKQGFVLGCLIISVMLFAGCAPPPAATPSISRMESIPSDLTKMAPETDLYPPILHSDEWEEPVPLPAPVNTAGGEDSPFITPDGQALYFFFTPDVRVPAERQLVDGVTGLYVAHLQDGVWGEPQRILLQDPDELSLDGCEFVSGDVMWFCSVRNGNLREIDIWKAYFRDGKWADWENAGERLNLEVGIGELHITADGREMYFHAEKEGGEGGFDIWVTRFVDGEWSDPENVFAVNTPDADGWPFVSQDGNELWFTRFYLGSPAIFRSVKVDGEWQLPELILSQFAGEPTLDEQGNIYFVHHYYKDGVMLEADIYVAYKKTSSTE